jgi:diacylglycerol kinase (ATP)
MKTKLIANPSAAKGRAVKYFDEIFNFFRSNGIEHDIQQTEYPGHAVEIAHDAVKAGYDRIIAAGGDGTIYEVVNGIIKADGDPVVGIIPTGTCNDFIKSIHMSKDVLAACEAIKAGKTQKWDVAHVGDRYCINAAGIGFDVKVAQDIHASRFYGSFLIYMFSVVKNIFGYKGMNLTVTLDGKTESRFLLMLTVANGVCYGGDFYISPESDPSDGLLNAIMIQNIPPLKRLGVLPKVLKGAHLTLPVVEQRLVREIKIRSSEPMVFQIEGELVEWPSEEITITVIPQRITGIIP